MSGCAGSSLGSSTKLLRSCALVFSPVKWAQSLFHAHRAVAKTKGVAHRKSTIWAELIIIGLPWWLSGEESTANSGATGDVGSILGLGRSLEKEWQPTPVFLMDRGAWLGYSPWGHRESDMT